MMRSHTICFALILFFGLGCGQNTPTGPQHNQGDFVLQLPDNVAMAFVKMGSRDVMMGKYEVTQAQWFSVLQDKAEAISQPWTMNAGPDENAIGDHFPAVNINIRTVHDFLNKLNELDPSHIYRLPLLTEWEDACLAGTQKPSFWFSEDPSIGTGNAFFDDYLWYADNANGHAHEVGLTKPNPWGIYDMHGNVEEFINTWGEGDYPRIDIPLFSSQPTTYPLLRTKGGGYERSAHDCRWQASNAYYSDLSLHGKPTVGFRVLRQPK